MKLYYAETLAPRKVCGLIKHINAPVELEYVDLGAGGQRSPAFVALNLNKKVPVLVDEGRVIWESNAILTYLAQRFAPNLLPLDQLPEIIRWLSWESAHFNRACGALYVEYVIKGHYNMGPPDEAAVAAGQKEFRKLAKVLDAHLQGRDYLVGDTLTIADFAVAATLPWAEEANIPLAEFPNAKRWHDNLLALPGWRDPFPVRG